MALSEHYELRYLDPEEAVSDFPSQWDHVIDKIDTAIHDAATDNVALSRLPNLPAGKTTSGRFADARIPTTIARKTDLDNLIEVDESAGRKISVAGEVIKYDSGWRDITATLRSGWTGQIQIRRTLTELNIALLDMLAPESASNNQVCDIPAGFEPVIPSGRWMTAPMRRDTNSVAFATISAAIFYLNRKDRFQDGFWNMITVPATDTLPASLPGVPA